MIKIKIFIGMFVYFRREMGFGVVRAARYARAMVPRVIEIE